MPPELRHSRTGTRSDTSKLLEPSGVFRELGKLHSPDRVPLSFVGWPGTARGCGVPMTLFLTPGTHDSKNSLQEAQPRAMLVPRGPAEGGEGRGGSATVKGTERRPAGHGFDGTSGAGKSSSQIHPHPSGKASKGAGLAEPAVKARSGRAAAQSPGCHGRVTSEPRGRAAAFPDPHPNPPLGAFRKEKPFKKINKKKSHSSFSLCLFSALR